MYSDNTSQHLYIYGKKHQIAYNNQQDCDPYYLHLRGFHLKFCLKCFLMENLCNSKFDVGAPYLIPF